MRLRKGAAVGVAAALVAGALGFSPPDLVSADQERSDRRCERNNNSVRKLLECITVAGVLRHEEAFQEIADDNDGTRVSGTPGYDESVDYVARKMRRAGYRVTIQEFEFLLFRILGPSELDQTAPGQATYTEGTDFAPTPQSDPGEVEAAVTAVDLQLGLGNASTSGCEPADYDNFPVGNIALIQRGTCTFEQKAETAAAEGASGVIFFNQGNTAAPDRNGIPAVTLGNTNTSGIPAVSTTYALGVQLSETPGLRMHMFVNVDRRVAETYNVIADSERHRHGGDVIMAGAHLDSVAEGPGIQDNGSGSSALLETALQMAKTKTENPTRFAWWGAEESGLLGSTFYVNDLVANDPEGLEDIELYLNFDMIASPNYGLFIYDGDGDAFGLVGPDGSDDIEAVFERYYAERGIPSEPTAFSGQSDYQAFINNGIPAGGLFTGAEGIKTAAQQAKWGGTAGIAYDPCDHKACDDIDNLSLRALDINSDAVAYAMLNYATGRDELNTGG